MEVIEGAEEKNAGDHALLNFSGIDKEIGPNGKLWGLKM
jgi:hypothetical protein